jgi:biotin carboxyl carrier protein
MKKRFIVDQKEVEIDLILQTQDTVHFIYNEKTYKVDLISNADHKIRLKENNQIHLAVGGSNKIVVDGCEIDISPIHQSRQKKSSTLTGGMLSPMPGKILKILKNVEDRVEIGDSILVMEAMKMEHTIKASKAGKIEKIFYKEGDQVGPKVELVKIC